MKSLNKQFNNDINITRTNAFQVWHLCQKQTFCSSSKQNHIGYNSVQSQTLLLVSTSSAQWLSSDICINIIRGEQREPEVHGKTALNSTNKTRIQSQQ